MYRGKISYLSNVIGVSMIMTVIADNPLPEDLSHGRGTLERGTTLPSWTLTRDEELSRYFPI